MVTDINLNQYLPLQDKAPHFQALVAAFVINLSTLSEENKEKLALFKVMELLNALVQTREKENSPNRLGPEKAAESFKLVRATIRSRQITLPGQPIVSLNVQELKPIIDEGCQTFHAGKHDSQQWERALALSTAQYIVLNEYLAMKLDQVRNYFQDLYPSDLFQDVTERFIKPYDHPFQEDGPHSITPLLRTNP